MVIAKVIGELLAAQMLNRIYPKMGVSRQLFADVRLIRHNLADNQPDEKGEHTYVQSIYIKNYIDDLWKYAYRKDCINEYAHRTADKAVIAEMVRVKIDQMERPSGAYVYVNVFSGPKARRVVSKTILENQQFMDDFADLAAARLLLGDYGLHNANFGVAKIDGHDRLVSLDYGAAFLNLIGDLDPYDISKTGITGYIDSFYKHHFFEYDEKIIRSESMAAAFASLGNISDDTMNEYISKAVNTVATQFGCAALREFCKRINMPSAHFENLPLDFVINNIHVFLIERLNQRKLALKQIGYNLLLEYCYDDKEELVDRSKLASVLAKNEDLLDYIISERFNRPFFRRGNDALIKEKIYKSAVELEVLNHTIELADSKTYKKAFKKEKHTLGRLKNLVHDADHLREDTLKFEEANVPMAKLLIQAAAMRRYNQAIAFCNIYNKQDASMNDDFLQNRIGEKIRELISWRQSRYLDIRDILKQDPKLIKKVMDESSLKDSRVMLLDAIIQVDEDQVIENAPPSTKALVMHSILSNRAHSSASSSSSSAAPNRP